MILDSSGLLVFLDRAVVDHDRVVQLLDEVAEPLTLSPFVLAEVDYLATTRLGSHVARALLADVAAGAFQLAPMSAGDLATALTVIDRNADLDVGLADASIVVLADRHRDYDVLTYDHRHFRAMTALSGHPFRLLPADAA